MSDYLALTKLRLRGKASEIEDIPEIEESDESENSDSEIRDAIAELSATMKEFSQKQVNVDLTPIMDMMQSMVKIQEQMLRKRKWSFKILQNSDGDLSEIVGTEL